MYIEWTQYERWLDVDRVSSHVANVDFAFFYKHGHKQSLTCVLANVERKVLIFGFEHGHKHGFITRVAAYAIAVNSKCGVQHKHRHCLTAHVVVHVDDLSSTVMLDMVLDTTQLTRAYGCVLILSFAKINVFLLTLHYFLFLFIKTSKYDLRNKNNHDKFKKHQI